MTGFRDVKEAELPVVSVRGFRGACHEAARAADGVVEQVVEATYPRGFHSAGMGWSAGRIAVLCNSVYPWVAFAEADVDGPKSFVEPPAWATAFAERGFTVMSRELLALPLDAVDTAALGRSEWAQIRSWHPESVGETVFNSWD